MQSISKYNFRVTFDYKKLAQEGLLALVFVSQLKTFKGIFCLFFDLNFQS